MELVLLAGVVGIAVVVLGLQYLRTRRAEAQSDEPSAHEFVWAVLAGLEARGVSGWPEDGTFGIRLADGRQLPLQEPWRRYARASSTEAREQAVAEALDAWASDGIFRTREAFVQHAAAVLREAGHAVAADAAFVLLELGDGTVVDLDPVWGRVQAGAVEAEALAAVIDDVAALDAAETLPVVVGRAEIALEQVRAWPERILAAADLGAGLAVRPGRLHGVARRWVDFDIEVLAEAVQQLAEAGHRFARGAGGVLASGFSDARDAALLLMPEDGFSQVGIGGQVVVWPVTASEVLVLGRDDREALVRACDAVVERIPVTRPLSLVPVVRVEGLSWAWLELPEDDDLAEVLGGLACEQRAADYERVRPALTALALREGLPAPVELRVDARPGGAVTVASWSGPALIPAEVDELEIHGRRVARVDVERDMELRDDLGLPYLLAGPAGS